MVGSSVRVVSSPFSDVKRGERGRVTSCRYWGTPHFVFRVLLSKGRSHLFRPDELEGR